MEQGGTIYSDVHSQDDIKPVIKEENIENRQLPLINKKKLIPIQRSRFQKRLPNISSAAKRSLIPVVDITTSQCEKNESKQTNAEKKVPPIEHISENVESNQDSITKGSDETKQLLHSNDENSLTELNITRPVIRKNTAAKIIHHTSFLKKPVPNIRNNNKNSSASQKAKLDLPVAESSQSSAKEGNLEPITIDVSEKSLVSENIPTNEENNLRQPLKETDVTEQIFPHSFDNSGNELNYSTSMIRKNASAAVHRTPFVKKPVPNVRNVAKTGSSASQEELSKIAPVEKSRRLSGCHDEEPSTPNTPVIPNSVKFPHITSILTSKKRNLKEKELPNKRRKYGKGDNPPERNKMTIMDLIYYNPSENPMQGSKTKSVQNEVFSPKLSDEATVECSTTEATDDTIRPVPKLVVNENGDINIDESSLFVQRNLPDPSLVQTVTDETTYSSFRKKPAKQWGKNETAKFYRALSLVGTDFGLMEKLMLGRTRRELKLKFKREERHNLDFINRAMYDSQTFDISFLEENVEHTEISEKKEIERNSDQKKRSGKRGRSRKRTDSADCKKIDSSNSEKIVSSNSEEIVSSNSEEIVSSNSEKIVSSTSEEIVSSNSKKKYSSNSKKINSSKSKKIGSSKSKKIGSSNRKKINSSNGKRINSSHRKRISFCKSKIVLPEEDVDSDSQNSWEENVLFPDDLLESSSQLGRSTSIHGSVRKNPALNMEVSNNCEDNEIVEIEFAYSRRNRKPKMLAEGFIDTNDLEIDEKDNLYDGALEYETECHSEVEIEPEENEILELQREVEKSGNVTEAYATVNSAEQSNLIIADSLSDTDLVSNVIADEVAPSKRTYTKKSKKPNVNLTRTAHQSNTIPCPSFTKYTPMEEDSSQIETSLKFTPDTNLKTYTRNKELNVPKCRNFLVSSMQSPSAKTSNQDKESTSLITSLNGSINQSIVIPVTPETNAKDTSSSSIRIPVTPETNAKDTSCSSVMIFAKAPNQENILHLFMYNKADLNTTNCKTEKVISNTEHCLINDKGS